MPTLLLTSQNISFIITCTFSRISKAQLNQIYERGSLLRYADGQPEQPTISMNKGVLPSPR